jgi:hypothetical protein
MRFDPREDAYPSSTISDILWRGFFECFTSSDVSFRLSLRGLRGL